MTKGQNPFLSLVYLTKLLFSGFLQLNGNVRRGQNNSKKVCRLFWFLVSSSSLFQVKQENVGRQYRTWFPFFRWHNRTKTGQHNGSKLGAVLHVGFVVIKRVARQNTPPGKHGGKNKPHVSNTQHWPFKRTWNWSLVKFQEQIGSLCGILRIIRVTLERLFLLKPLEEENWVVSPVSRIRSLFLHEENERRSAGSFLEQRAGNRAKRRRAF